MTQEQSAQGVTRSSARATAGVALSRLSGLARTPIVNAVFGAGVALDSFYTAFRFPNALRDLFADGALSSAFTKVLVEARAKGEEHEKQLVAKVTGCFLLLTLAIAICGSIYSKQFLILVSGAEFNRTGAVTLAGQLFALLVFYLPLTMVSSVCMAMLAVRGKTFRATVASAMANVGVVFGALILAPICVYINIQPIFGMAVGMILGGIFQISYQIMPLINEKVFPFPDLNPLRLIQFKPLGDVFLLMGPRILGQGAMVLALLINTHFATDLAVGSMTNITHAQVIILVPVGLFGVASGFASLPTLTALAHKKEFVSFTSILNTSLTNTLFLSAFTLLVFSALSVPLCAMLFWHGHGDIQSTVSTAVAVCAYGAGMVFNSGLKVLVQGFYALGNTKYIVINSFVYLAINAALSAYLAPRYGIMGLGLSNSISACADFILCQFFLFKATNREFKPKFCFVLLLIVFVFLFSAFGILNAQQFLAYWNLAVVQFNAPHFSFLIATLLVGFVGTFLALAVLPLVYYFGSAEIKSVFAKILKKIGVKIRN